MADVSSETLNSNAASALTPGGKTGFKGVLKRLWRDRSVHELAFARLQWDIRGRSRCNYGVMTRDRSVHELAFARLQWDIRGRSRCNYGVMTLRSSSPFAGLQGTRSPLSDWRVAPVWRTCAGQYH
ncbi:hypothetical protein CSUI_005282 [Cystoisospora suis]|uniref:Uncharacterized protein n=1 Tax=Cystoisospora suis TaxID=483139 RepID=A0A2C6K754_9APIC|nr:hypothetical protein CSUI_005282 [Cystoisospora suis]